jgi:hypothetical protein
MKHNQLTTLRGLFFLCLVALLGSCNYATEADYNEISDDLCDCFNKEINKLSPTMQSILTTPNLSEALIEKKVEEAIMADPTVAADIEKDGLAMQNMEKSMEGCLKTIEKKYDNVFTMDNEKEVQKKLIDIMKSKPNCAIFYNLAQLGGLSQ